MISLTLDDHREIGNEIWIEDVWSPEVSDLFPLELQKGILSLNNEWHDLRKDLDKQDSLGPSTFGPNYQENFLKVCLTDNLKMNYLIERRQSEGKETPLWLGFNEKIHGENPPWSAVLQGLLNLNKLLQNAFENKQGKVNREPNPIVIELPSFRTPERKSWQNQNLSH